MLGPGFKHCQANSSTTVAPHTDPILSAIARLSHESPHSQPECFLSCIRGARHVRPTDPGVCPADQNGIYF